MKKRSERKAQKRFLTFADLKTGDWYIPWVSYRFAHQLQIKVDQLADHCNYYSLVNGLYGCQADCDKVVRIDQPPKEYCLPILITSNRLWKEVLDGVEKYRRKKG